MYIYILYILYIYTCFIIFLSLLRLIRMVVGGDFGLLVLSGHEKNQMTLDHP